MSDTIMMSEEVLGSTSPCNKMSQDCAVRTLLTTIVLLHLSRMRLENSALSSTHGGSARSHIRNTVNGRPCRLRHAGAPINSVWQLSLMAERNTILEKGPTQGRVVAVKRGFHPSLQLPWNTNARVLRANFEIHTFFVLRSDLVRSKIDDT